MPEKDKGIRREDCPEGTAPLYPGKKTKNNKDGTDLSRKEFVAKVIEDWVNHFGDEEKYKTTCWGNKIVYLMRYLEPLGVKRTDAKKLLIDTETKLAKLLQENELTNSQNTLSQEMEIDADFSGRSRWAKDQEIIKFLEMSDNELFGAINEIPENVKSSHRYKKREKEYCVSLPDNQLITIFDSLSPYTKTSKEIKEKHRQLVEKYMDEHFGQASSQEILMKIPETPACIQNSEAYKERLHHLTFAERSKRLVLQNIEDSLKELEKTKEGRRDADIVIAAVSHATFGHPGLNITKDKAYKTKKAKENLLTGKATTLKLPESKKRQMFPDSVKAIALNHWMENTIPEPAKQFGKTIEEGGEIVSTRYQDKTDRECYMNFVEECQEKIKMEMKKVADQIMISLSTRPDTADKKRRLEYAISLPDKFPSQDWFIQQRPKETKPLCNHTTGLCHLCEAAKQNFSTIVNAVKRRCKCGSHSCPNFICACPVEEDEEDYGPCSCPPCECEICWSCKVCISKSFRVGANNMVQSRNLRRLQI